MEKLRFQKNDSKFFYGSFLDFWDLFLWNAMIVKGLLTFLPIEPLGHEKSCFLCGLFDTFLQENCLASNNNASQDINFIESHSM